MASVMTETGPHDGARQTEPSTGLHTPEGPLGLLESPRRLTPLRIAVQVVGAIVSIGLLIWCVSIATRDLGREEVEQLRSAGAGPVAALLALAGASVVLNGLAFWVTLLPLRRLSMIDMVAVNAVATFLAYLPFKLGALARVLIHHRRDHVPFRELIPWLAGYSALSLATLLPLVLVSAILPRIDAVWAVAACVGVLACNGAGIVLGRLSERWSWLARLSLGSWRIVREPAAAASCAGVKLADVAVHAMRFGVGAAVLGESLPPDRAILFALLYFLLGVLSPTGTFGLREGGVVLGGGALFAMDEQSRAILARIVLVVSATDAIALFVLAPLGGARLRLDRLLRARGATRRRPTS